MNQPVVSIIVPVYKAEKYLFRCVDSILNQTFKDWECILVDDGSPDKSGAICDKYAQRDSRIKVIHKENGGVSSARQAGLEAVKGEFVIHADSDDWLAPNMLEELVTHQNKTGADFIVFDFFRVTNGQQLRICQRPRALDNVQVLKDIISGHLYACCWNKLVRRSLIVKYGASFPQGINLGEDKCFLASLLKNPVSVSFLPEPLYYYDATTNNNSLVRTISLKSIEEGVGMVEYLERLLGTTYESEIYEIKRRLKLRVMTSDLMSRKEMQAFYKEINNTLIMDVLLLKRHMREDIALFFCALGASKMGNLFLRK